jgi:hypothetical protein
MSFATSLQKHGGAGHLRSFDSLIPSSGISRCSAIVCSFLPALWLVGMFFASDSAANQAESAISTSAVSSPAAERCRLKLIRLEAVAALDSSERKQTTRFSEEEVNSYLAEDLSPQYHPCLKTIGTTFKEGRIQVVAEIDFDRLGAASTGAFSKMVKLLFSGKHSITAQGKLQSGNGEAFFDLEKAFFDDKALPNFLVEEILTAVGQNQNPPFDPMQPSELPYKIDKVDVHPGYIIVYQQPGIE